MSVHPLEFPFAKGYRVERSVSQLSSILPAIVKMKANINDSLPVCEQILPDIGDDQSASTGHANQDGGRSYEAESREDFEEFRHWLEEFPDSDQIALMGKDEFMKFSRFVALMFKAQADMAESKFIQLEDVKEIEEAITYRAQVLLLTPDGHAEQPRRFGALGTALLRRFMRLGELTDLDMAVEYQTQAVHRAADGDPDMPIHLSNLGSSYQSRFGRFGELEDLKLGIDYKSQAMLLTPDEHPDMPGLLNNLGLSYMTKFGRLGEPADLNMAIDYLSRAVLLIPDENLEKANLLSNLGCSYQFRFGCLGELADLNMAINYSTQALMLNPSGHPHKPGWLNNLGISYRLLFERLGELADLEKAIDYQTRAVLLSPDNSPDKPRRLNNLGNSFECRFERLGDLSDLDKAYDYKTQAVLLIPDGHSELPAALTNLGNSYESRFGRLGKLADLNQAINYQSQAVLLTPDGHPDKFSRLHNLGISYESRFGRLGELADLNKAIDHHTKAMLLTPEEHPDKPCALGSLGISYQSRFQLLGELADLHKAIELLTQAILLTPDGHPDKPRRLNHLGVSYQSRFGHFGQLADLNMAIDYKTQALLLTPEGHPAKSSRLNNLGKSYESRFSFLGKVADVDKAIDYQTQALELTPDRHTDQPQWCCNLGMSYFWRFIHLRNLPDLESAHSYFQRGAQLNIIHPLAQSMCARMWAQCSLLLGSSPQFAYERSMELIPQYIWLGTTIDQRYTLVSTITDLATEAAAWAISIEASELALEWLEQSRSIIWNQILQLRAPFDELILVDPLLAQDLKNTASKLEAAGSRRSTSLSNHQSTDLEQAAQQHHCLASDWERILGQVRALPGFERFLLPRQANELMLAATDGPVVVLNAHSTRCDALIIVPKCDKIAHLPLSRFSLIKLEDACTQLQSMFGHGGSRMGGFKRSNPAPSSEEIFRSILATLWSDIVQPVLDIITCRYETSVNELPHITWCTTGALSFLPLHAAGCYDGTQPNTFDLIVSSYTPTLSALLTSGTSATSLDVGLLTVGQEQTEGFCHLPSTVHELAAIKAHSNAVPIQQLDGADAKIGAVLEAMGNHSWVHLACHATQDTKNPALSAFHLHDGSLTLETIAKRSFKNKGLAFLSACQTATGNRELADEAVHLAAGMLIAGYPSVIATMWSIWDEDGPDIAQVVYADLLKDGKMDHKQASRALHKAVVELREKVGYGAFERWVPFIHIGV